MIIVFFEYEAKPFFFGVTAGKQTTRCSLSRDDVANELYVLQKDEWRVDSIEGQPTHVQGVVLRSLEFVDGRWVVVDVEDGIMTIVAEAHDGELCFFISASEPNEVYVADDPVATSDLVAQVGSGYGSSG